jgi:hypothetical protein
VFQELEHSQEKTMQRSALVVARIDEIVLVARFMMVTIALAALALGASLWIGAAHTSQFFAWTIKSPTAASALGGFYIGIGTYAFLGARTDSWETMRVIFPPAIFGPAVLLIPTAIHHTLFDFQHAVAWLWLILYIAFPPALAMVYFLGRRVEEHPLPVRAPFSRAQRTVLAIVAVVLVAEGLLLLVHPQTLISVWPWPLTPLIGRAYGCWLLTSGIGAAVLASEEDWLRARIGVQAQLTGAGALLIAPLIHPDQFHASGGGIVWLASWTILALTAGVLLWLHRSRRLSG